MRTGRHTIIAALVLLVLATTAAWAEPGDRRFVLGPPDQPTSSRIGAAARRITPVTRPGEEATWPPPEWQDYFTPNPITGVWGERFEDLDGDGCYDGLTNEAGEPLLDGSPPESVSVEPHVDDPWNQIGDRLFSGAFSVRGVTIVGDPASAGKWDGLWGGAGFGSQCAEGAKDNTWARAIVIENGETTVAMVALDVVGLFNIEVQRMRREMAARYPEMAAVMDELVISSTHTHEGVDTMGYWGQVLGVDGKSPAYQAFIRSQILDAVHDAWLAREPALARFAVTEFTVGIRDSRPPNVIDPYLQAAQFLRPDGTVIATAVNWSNHPEAQGGDNGLVSSDFPHATRVRLEAEYPGSVGVYFSGSVGGLMTPLRADVPGHGTDISWERTYALGEMVAEAAIAALGDPAHKAIDIAEVSAARRTVYMDADNNALNALNAAGVFDLPTYAGGDSWGADHDDHTEGVFAGWTGPQFQTEMVRITLGPAVFLTVPGELFPELELGGHGRPDCPAAHTGRPFEPVIAEQYDQEFQFILGLGQDELGYIVPGYDHWLTHLPETDGSGNGVLPVGALEVDDPCGEGHYEETVSGSSTLAPWVTCIAAELAGHDLWEGAHAHEACARTNTRVGPFGVNPGDEYTGNGEP